MKYQITVTFTTDRELTPDEQSLFAGACHARDLHGRLSRVGEDMEVEVAEVNSSAVSVA